MATMTSTKFPENNTTTLDFKTDFRYVFGLSCIFLVATLLFFIGVQSFNHFFSDYSYLVLVPSFLIALIGLKFKRQEMTAALQPIFYLAVFIPLIYGIFSYLSFIPRTDAELVTVNNIHIMLAISSITALASISRPFLAMIPLSYLPWRDATVEKMIGVMPNDRIDWIVLVEMGIFILLCIGCLKLAEKHFKKETIYGVNRGDIKNPIKPVESIFIVAICLHLANYFYSFFQKLILDGGPLTWVLENPTHEYLGYAIERGLFPMASLPVEISHQLYQTLEFFVIPVNALVFITQALAIFAFSNRKLLIGLTLFYDLMHLTIFALTGIFFWKWILLNLTIVFAMNYWKHEKVSASFNLAVFGFVGISVIFFSIARLGWYDLHGGRITNVVAHYNDGSKIEAPTNYFLSYSFRLVFSYDHATTGGFQDNVWAFGATGKGAYQTLVNSKTCNMELSGTAIDPNHPRRGINILKSVLKNHHQYVLENVNKDGYINYDLYPHHVWSDPFAFNDFKASDKRNIVGFEIINRSMCPQFDKDGNYTPIVKHKDSVYVSIE